MLDPKTSLAASLMVVASIWKYHQPGASYGGSGMPSVPEAYYFFTLAQSNNYKSLTPTVRSQLKRAVALYSDYRKTELTTNGRCF